MTERLTSQRQIILNYLKSTKIHPSADTIYHTVRKILPQISLGTVYRNLEFLKNKGKIIEISGNVKRFDADISDHHHFICEHCDSIYDIKGNSQNLIKDSSHALGKINKYSLYLYGVCRKCLNK